MTEPTEKVPAGLADLPFVVRQAREAENFREIQAGLTRAHLATAAYQHVHEAAHLARLLREAPALAATLGGT